MLPFITSNARATTYTLYQYNYDTFRIVKQKNQRLAGWEEVRKKKTVDIDYNKKDEEVERCSLSRTKRNIREIALCNDFEYFATITINSQNADRFSLSECQQLFKKKVKKLKRKNNNFAYIFITEKHKNGAFHFHGLVKGVNDFYVNDNGYLSSLIFDEVGFNSFSKIKSYNKCCNYITKYITKDCVRNEAGNIYFSSRGLKKADKYQIKPFEPSSGWNYENDYCCIKDYKVSEMSREELLEYTIISEK